MGKSSDYSGFYKLPITERLKLIKEFAALSDDEVALLQKPGALGSTLPTA